MAQSPRLTSTQRRRIREIKARHLSAAYEKRLIRGVKQGKTRQESRGHRPGEAARRRAFQREQNEGLSTPEIKSIRKWYATFSHYYKQSGEGGLKTDIPDVEDIIDFARDEGMPKFREYRKVWDAQRKDFIRDVKNGTWASKGIAHLELITTLANVRPRGDIEWLYYH